MTLQKQKKLEIIGNYEKQYKQKKTKNKMHENIAMQFNKEEDKNQKKKN